MSCVVTRKPHALQTIYSRTSRGGVSEDVVRWCSDCGAVVVDSDIDGRADPGGVLAMKFPALAIDAARAGKGEA